VPSTRPGGRVPHAWIGNGVSTLDLVDPERPTLFVKQNSPLPEIGSTMALAVAEIPPTIWAEVFELGADQALVVRPDQHIAFRGDLNYITEALAHLF
jgi:putative polyketide hydroxylase